MNTTYKFDPKNMLQNCSDILTVSEAAKVLRIRDDIMQQLIDSGKISHLEIGGNSLVLKIFLLEYLESLCPLRYTQATAQNKVSAAEHLGNQIPEFSFVPISEGETEMATKSKINQPVMINGEKRWITANSMQEFADKVAKLLSTPQSVEKHLFSDYAWNWYNTFSKPSIETATAVTYKRQLTLHILPAFDKGISKILPWMMCSGYLTA